MEQGVISKIQQAKFDQSGQIASSMTHSTSISRMDMQVGLAHFRTFPVINHRKLDNLSQYITTCLGKNTIIIHSFYLFYRWEFLFKSIDRISNKKLVIEESYYKNVLNDIGGPMWDKLLVIKLVLLNTQNVEALSWINCPNLKTLWIGVNTTSLTRPLGKTMFRNLSFLQLKTARLCNIQLSRMKISQNDSLHMLINSNQYRFSPKLQISDISFYSKIGYHNQRERTLEPNDSLQGLSKRVKIGRKMYSRIIDFYKDQTQNADQEQKTTNQSTISRVCDCLFKRKFLIVNKQEEQFEASSDQQESSDLQESQ